MQITPEEIYHRRREFIGRTGLWIAAAQISSWLSPVLAQAKLNYKVNDPERPLTPEKLATTYNNFYEFGLDKSDPHRNSGAWRPAHPWKVEITGLAEKNRSYTLEELIQLAGGTEERVYRFRCVEAWSMVVPWTGFSLAALIEKLKPKTSAKYVAFTSHGDPKDFPGIRQNPHYPWPYTEGLRLDEAKHPLTLMATGMYGKPLPNQNGAPLRLVVPWKYGFKSIKSIRKIEFTENEPKTLWNQLAPTEYGFYANVNPEVDHPRWSQKTERVLDGKLFPTRIKTLKFNGYEKEVASLYQGFDLKKNY